ncbi:MAG: DUF2141 domain-containing protein, partial [Rhizomicrobium sp.]
MAASLAACLATGVTSAAYAANTANDDALIPGDCPAGASEARLQLAIDQVHSTKGNVTVVVYGDKPSDFLAKGKKLVKVRMPAKPGITRACLILPKPGTYAVAAFHDEDNDHHLTRNMLGLPVEGYAFSNNPKALLGL